MGIDLLRQQSYFEAYRTGQSAALLLLFDQENPFLYDYLMRMTGDANRSAEAVALLGTALTSIADKKQWGSLSELRFFFYGAIRRQMRALWHSDLGRLENRAILATPRPQSASEKKRLQLFLRLERALGQLPTNQREILILHLRAKLTFGEVALLMDQPREHVVSLAVEGLNHLIVKYPELPRPLRSGIVRLPAHPTMDPESSTATDLHDVMRGLRRGQGLVGLAQATPWYVNLLAVVVAVFVLGRLGYYVAPLVSEDLFPRLKNWILPFTP